MEGSGGRHAVGTCGNMGAGGGTIIAGALGAAVETHQPRPWGIGAERSKPFLGNVTET